MTEPEPHMDDVFDVERIRRLVELMRQHDLAEIDLRQRSQRIRLCRGGQVVCPPVAASVLASPLVATSPLPPMHAPPPAPPVVSPVATEEPHIAYIRSPMVGTFYTKPNPNAEPFVKVGDHVDAEKVICIIEAMKVFNEIPAETTGRIVAVLVGDEEPVDFGKPLFKIDTRS
jgi:acetyl-CoA carboxylase biotin carboxyl carrier protein